MTDISNNMSMKVKTKSRSNRCTHPDCNKRLMLSNVACRCSLRFCNKHRHAETHNCTFDYKTYGKKLLEKTIPEVKVSKINKI